MSLQAEVGSSCSSQGGRRGFIVSVTETRMRDYVRACSVVILQVNSFFILTVTIYPNIIIFMIHTVTPTTTNNIIPVAL